MKRKKSLAARGRVVERSEAEQQARDEIKVLVSETQAQLRVANVEFDQAVQAAKEALQEKRKSTWDAYSKERDEIVKRASKAAAKVAA